MIYGVTVQVEHTRDGWHGSYGLPYFQVRACSEADAVETARRIVEGQTVGARIGETRTLHIVAVAL